MKLKHYSTALVALSGIVSGQNNHLKKDNSHKSGLGKDCKKSNETIRSIVDQHKAGYIKARKKDLAGTCATDEHLTANLYAELHQAHQVCYFKSKKMLLDEGKIKYFTLPTKIEGGYNPKKDYNLLKDLVDENAHSKSKNGSDKYLIKRIGNDFAAVSLQAASADTLKVFKSFSPEDTRLDRPDTYRFLFLAGQGEVPVFERALYAMSLEMRVVPALQQDKILDEINIPSEIVKAAIENDSDIVSEDNEFLFGQLDQQGVTINIGKGADSLGVALRNAVKTINDACPTKDTNIIDPLKALSLTETSSYFPMKWDSTSLKELHSLSDQKKDEL